jgi:hypothetical protein
MNPVLDFSERIRVLPVIHGSIDFAVKVREELLSHPGACLCVPLPGSWREDVLAAVERLPTASAVVQSEAGGDSATYVPIDPCQPVIAALRLALRERMPIEFVDLEAQDFDAPSVLHPDPFALKKLPLEKFLAAVLLTLKRPPEDSNQDQRCRRMAFELHRLELEFDRLVFLCDAVDWPWIREAYMERRLYPEHENYFAPIHSHDVEPKTLAFFLGELPFITALYERARATLDPDESLAVDGVKELLQESRSRWSKGRDDGGGWLGPQLLQTFLQYVRNLTLMNRRLSPDLYTLVTAAKQIAGDGFARKLLETARDYPVENAEPQKPFVRMGIGRADVPTLGVVEMISRLPGPAVSWRSCDLRPEAEKIDRKKWRMMWNPYEQCSWPPEDDKFESFQTHVREQAKNLIGQDLARSEKFTASIKDGLDIRETLRHWYSGDLYVKEIPPTRGGLEIVVFLFDPKPDFDKYPWQTTWSNEHEEESYIAFFGTNFMDDVVGPGIARSRFGGVFFLFPPRPIMDVWSDPRISRKGPLDDRLIAGAILNSKAPHIAVVSPTPLKASWRAAAKARGKKLVHLPLSRFSGRMLDRLRTFHVLNGHDIRSYAARFIAGD